ncbi:Plasma membrane t-SNARE, secretory vesicle fusion [Pseudocyphellaria aurata]|nr:Plasma membrane t-SNARE, secretory vesicle fusion [Pseudocyphellaria aurata]
MAQYGGYSSNTAGGYGQANPYDQHNTNRYDQGAGNPYDQQGSDPYSDSAHSQGGHGSGGYGGDDVEMRPLNGQAAQRDPNAILNECREIDRGIDSIERNLERLRFLQTRAIDDPDASQGTQTNRELDNLSTETMTMYRNFGGRIKAIKQQRESGEPRNKPQVGKVDRKLKNAINEYQQVESEFRKKLSEQMARQYRIVKPEASEEEVRAAIEDTSNNQVFSQALLQSNRRGQSQSALRAVQGRHEAIQKIERQMIELAQLFQDVEAAVVQQEPAVEEIETKAGMVNDNVGKANVEIDGAITKARSRNRKKWICLGLVVLLLVIIVLVVVLVLKLK